MFEEHGQINQGLVYSTLELMQEENDNHQLPTVGTQDVSVQGSAQIDEPAQAVVPKSDATDNQTQNNSGPTQSVAYDASANGLPDAADVDLIEKAWVEKAKEIVRSTVGDPYSQTKELSKVKAVYIEKRYNKHIAVDEQSGA